MNAQVWLPEGEKRAGRDVSRWHFFPRSARGGVLALALLAGTLPSPFAFQSPTGSPGNPSPASPSPAGAAEAAERPVVETTVEDYMARAIARSLLGMAGGLNLAIWSDLAQGQKGTRYGTRYLRNRQTVYTCYPDFVRKFSRFSNDPNLLKNRALLIIGHAGYGLGLQDAIHDPRDVQALKLPPSIQWDRQYAPLEFVAVSRIRLDLADQYDLIVLGQCNPRKCLRFVDSSIPVGPELYAQIERLSDRKRQLTIVRNPDENIYLVGKKVVYREPYQAPAYKDPLPRVVCPDVVGEQSVHPNPEKSSQTDVFILAGRWTDEPINKLGEKVVRPHEDMIAEADRRVRAMIALERRANPKLAEGSAPAASRTPR